MSSNSKKIWQFISLLSSVTKLIKTEMLENIPFLEEIRKLSDNHAERDLCLFGGFIREVTLAIVPKFLEIYSHHSTCDQNTDELASSILEEIKPRLIKYLTEEKGDLDFRIHGDGDGLEQLEIFHLLSDHTYSENVHRHRHYNGSRLKNAWLITMDHSDLELFGHRFSITRPLRIDYSCSSDNTNTDFLINQLEVPFAGYHKGNVYCSYNVGWRDEEMIESVIQDFFGYQKDKSLIIRMVEKKDFDFTSDSHEVHKFLERFVKMFKKGFLFTEKTLIFMLRLIENDRTWYSIKELFDILDSLKSEEQLSLLSYHAKTVLLGYHENFRPKNLIRGNKSIIDPYDEYPDYQWDDTKENRFEFKYRSHLHDIYFNYFAN